MDIKEYCKMSKETGKTVVVMVRGDLIIHSFVNTSEIDFSGVGDFLISCLHEGIKEKDQKING